MATKIITIKNDVYNLLKQIKGRNESFSDLLERLVHNVDTVSILENIASSLDLGDSGEIIAEIRKKRNEGSEQLIID